MATLSQPPLRFTSSPRSAPASPRNGTGWRAPAKSPGSTSKRSDATATPMRPSQEKFSAAPKPQSAGMSVAHCILRLDALPVRCMFADERLVYLSEAPLRGHAGHSTPGGHSGRLTARDPRSGRVSRQLAGGGNTISCLLVTKDEHVWCGSFDGLLRVTRRGGQPLHEARAHAACVHALVAGVEAVFSSGGDFLVRAWSLSLVPLRTLRAHTSSVHCLAAPIPTPARGYSGEAFSQGGAGIWSGGEDTALHVWSGSEAAGFAHVTTIEDFGAPIRVLAAQDVGAPRVWAADAAGALRVYDAKSRSILRSPASPGNAPPTTCITCTSNAVWVGDLSGSITIYDGSSLAKLQRVDAVHVGAVGGLAAPRGTGLVWSFGADCAVRGFAMSEQLQDRLSRARESIEGQHSALLMMRSMFPRAAAATAGRLEAAAQRSEMLTRRLLDVEVSMSIGEPHAPSSVVGREVTHDATHEVESVATADAKRRSLEYEMSVDALNQAQRELATDVEESLLALRGRIDELLAFVQAGLPGNRDVLSGADAVSAPVPMNAPMWAVPSARSASRNQ